MSITKFTKAVQIKLWQYTNSFRPDYSKPEHKFIHQGIFGILKGGQAQINTIGRSLQEKKSLKKVTKRLSYHLGKTNMSERIHRSTIKAQRQGLSSCRYIILDDSDIVKKYARKMEGISCIRDGSTNEISVGYHLCDVSAVNRDGSVIIPLYSELYSHEKELNGENGRILKAIDLVMEYASQDSIWVMDRGMDRNVLYDALDDNDYNYLVRQTGNRNLVLDGESMSLKQVSQRVKLKWDFKITRIHKNKKRTYHFKAGALKVKRPGRTKQLWLVVVKYKKGGYSWYLLSSNEPNAQAAVRTVMEGYPLRWKIEEVHRQIKSDYHLEDMRLLRYEALKTLNALVWMAISFLYTRLDSIAPEIIYEPELSLVNRKKFSDIFRFIYYKLAYAIKKILALAKVHYPPRRLITGNNQLIIPFTNWW